jgi:outer membrane murein-binding lipoprotein Lpp
MRMMCVQMQALHARVGQLEREREQMLVEMQLARMKLQSAGSAISPSIRGNCGVNRE